MDTVHTRKMLYYSVYCDNTENRPPSTGLSCNIIDEFLAPESHYPLDKATEMDEFEEYFQSSTTSLRSGPPFFSGGLKTNRGFPSCLTGLLMCM